jgi:hypothetical protein
MFAWYNIGRLCLEFIRKIKQDLEDEERASLLRNEAFNVPTISISINTPGRAAPQCVNVPYIIQNWILIRYNGEALILKMASKYQKPWVHINVTYQKTKKSIISSVKILKIIHYVWKTD